MLTYHQSTGELFAADGFFIGRGYAGGNIPPNFDATARNNPARQFESGIGPLPQGKYSIGTAYTDPHLGPVAMRLDPDQENVMFGRAGFFIHADSWTHPGQASEGCIVLPLAARQTIARSQDRELQVICDPIPASAQ